MASIQTIRCKNCGEIIAVLDTFSEEIREVKHKKNKDKTERKVMKDSKTKLAKKESMVCPACGVTNNLY